MNRFSLQKLSRLLELQLSDPRLEAFGTPNIKRSEYLGFLEYPEQGVSLAFTEGEMCGVKDRSLAKELFLTGGKTGSCFTIYLDRMKPAG